MRGFVGARFTKVAVGSVVRPKYTRGNAGTARIRGLGGWKGGDFLGVGSVPSTLGDIRCWRQVPGLFSWALC